MYLIVGATGSLGGQVAKALLAKGERVRAVVRPESSSPMRRAGRFTDPDELRAKGAEVVEADLRQPESFDSLLAGVKSVLMTASGTKRAPPDSTEAIDVNAAAALAEAAKRAGVEHFVYLSTLGAGLDAPELSRAKGEGENAIRATGQTATFVRPALFMQDWVGFVLGAQLQAGTRIQLMGEHDAAKVFVDEGDVVKLVTEILLAGPPTSGESTTVIEFATDTASHGEIVDRMARASGLPLTVERLPMGQPVTTAEGPVAGLLTHLLSIAAVTPHDETLTPEVAQRYGIRPLSIDGFLARMFAAAPI
ncbi:MAG TPA: NmrA family NAD(P)-binding protein [Trueperaceae bacterium]|nr:NmrA family NAD(P)-binding protein [Trueperaceae bacterium]